MIQRIRAKAFQSLLRQEVAYFDRPDNSTGALCTRLSTEASDVQGVRLEVFIYYHICIYFRLLVFELEQCYKIYQILVLDLF